MVAYFLFREFQHHVISSPDTPIVHYSKILVLNQKIVSSILYGRRISIFFVNAVTVIILLGESQQSFVVPLILECVQPHRVIGKLKIGHGRIIHFFFRCYCLLFINVLLQFQCNLIHLLGNQRSRSFHIQQSCLDELWRFLQFVEPSFEVGTTVLFYMFRHAVTLGNQCAA